MANFVYPYNFVGIPERSGQKTPPQREAAVSHKAWTGLTGKVTLSLSLFTPLAMPDAARRTEEDGYPRFPFLRTTQGLTIQGTALKGMFRSVYEALTNSCFSQIMKDPLRFRKRMTGLGIKREGEYMGIITRNNQETYVATRYERGVTTIDPVETVKPGRVVRENGGLCIKPMAWVYLYDAPHLPVHAATAATRTLMAAIETGRNHYLKDSDKADDVYRIAAGNHLNTYNGIQHTLVVPFSPPVPPATPPPGGWIPGAQYYLKLHPGDKNPPGKWGRRNQIALVDTAAFNESFAATYIATVGVKLLFEVTGYLRVAGLIPNKHGDFLFVDLEQTTPSREPLSDPMLKAYREANTDNPFNLNQIREGNTVWYQTGRGYGFGPNRLQAGFAQIFPFVSPFELKQKLAKSHYPCSELHELCPACRLFGIAGDASWAGRIRISDGVYHGAEQLQYIPLKELSSPKPAYAPFYLKPNASYSAPVPFHRDIKGICEQLPGFQFLAIPQQNGLKDSVKALGAHIDHYHYGYDENEARGRKFYLHHGTGFQLGFAQDDRQDHRDRRAKVEVLEPAENSKFPFSLSFRNLAPWELGLVIVTAELSLGDSNHVLAHKLGRGRPLGLGSVSITVEPLEGICSGLRFTVFGQNANSPSDGGLPPLDALRILGHLWLIETFISGGASNVMAEIKAIGRRALQSYLLGGLNDALETLPQGVNPQGHDNFFDIEWVDSPTRDMLEKGLVYPDRKVFCAEPTAFDAWLLELAGCLDNESGDTFLSEVIERMDLIKAGIESRSKDSEDILASSYDEVLGIVRQASASIPHIQDLATILRWNPTPFPQNLPVRYPATAGDDIRPWFNTNFSPLPFPKQLANVTPWTLKDEIP